VNLLLDTHVLIWVLENNPSLSAEARDAIIDGNNLVFVSAVSVWEISIKRALGKLVTPDNLLQEISAHRLERMEITAEHADLAGRLPMIHQDPFDRMLIAQATIESLTLISRDGKFALYDVMLMKA
jgi:PIN domain nuclease of toxin-antitoxin system